MNYEPLFYKSALAWDDIDFRKYAEEKGFKLPEDEAKWAQSITSHVSSSIPFLGKYPSEISIDDKDTKLGYAKGRLVVGGKVVIPLIIREYKLLPLDVFVHGEDFYPLTEKSIEEIMMTKSLGVKPISRKEYKGENTSLQSSSSPSGRGNAGYKIGSALDRMSPASISAEDYSAFMDKLSGDKSLSIAMYHIAPDALKKIASKVIGDKEELPFQDKVRKVASEEDWEINVLQLHKTASGNVAMYTSSDYYPMAYQHNEMTIEDAVGKFGPDCIKKVASGEPVTMVMGRGGFSINTPAEMHFKMEPMEKFGQYDVMSHNHRIIRGTLIPEVYDFSMNKLAGMKLFTSKDCFSMQEKIAGRRVMAGPRAELESAEIRHGIRGTFCFRYGEKVASLEPFTVSTLPLTSGESIIFEAMTMRGEPVHFTVMPGMASAAPGEKRGSYLIPSFWQFVKVGDFQEPIMQSTPDMKKYASPDTDDKSLGLLWNGVHYRIIGAQVSNMAQQLYDLDRMQARFFLTAFGLTPEFADTLLNKAKLGGEVRFIASVSPTINHVVVTNAIENQDGSRDTKYAAAVDMVVSAIRERALIKEALTGKETETVDNVLSLNFVNRNNVGEFVESIDEFKDSQSKLARLLVASRLGIEQIDPQAVKTAMENLSEVIDGLEVLKSSMSVKGKYNRK
jgi:hypothetical protein